MANQASDCEPCQIQSFDIDMLLPTHSTRQYGLHPPQAGLKGRRRIVRGPSDPLRVESQSRHSPSLSPHICPQSWPASQLSRAP
ncbi:hypothetical protein VTK56DRAFT_9146 [Thermocarpiscus australiensis]